MVSWPLHSIFLLKKFHYHKNKALDNTCQHLIEARNAIVKINLVKVQKMFEGFQKSCQNL